MASKPPPTRKFDRYMATARAPRMAARRNERRRSGSVASFSGRRKSLTRTGTISRATTRDEVNTTIRVMGRCFMNSPMISFQNTNGKNAARVVAVEAIMGMAISPTARQAASHKGTPCRTKRWIFSTTTMALSTSIPRARTRPNNTIIFTVEPRIPSTTNEINMDMGMANPTKRALRNPRKKNNMEITKIIPIIMLFSRLETMSRTYSD